MCLTTNRRNINPDPNRLSIIMITIAFTVIVNFIVNYLISNSKFQFYDSLSIVTIIVIGLFMMAYLITANHFRKEIEKNRHGYEKALENQVHNGFIQLDMVDAFDLVSDRLKNTSEFRVTGNIMQEELEQGFVPVEIKRYINATERRFRERKKSKRFSYKRLTTSKVSPFLKNHLNKLFACSKRYGHKIGVIFSDKFDFEQTFIILDESFMILNMNKQISGHREQELCFFTEDSNIIKRYINKFEKNWDEQTAVTKEEDFKNHPSEFPVLCNESALKDLRILTKLQELKYNIEKIENDSIIKLHVYSEIIQAADRINGFANWNLTINHIDNNSNLNNIFYGYIKRLESNDSYCAIAVNEFYKNIDYYNKFIDANRTALMNGAELKRVFVIDNNKFLSDINNEYKKSLKAFIKDHITLSSNFLNYEFKILFTNDYQVYKSSQLSFGLWFKKNEKMVFMPDHNGKGDTIYKTNLHYIDTNIPCHPSFKKNNEKFIHLNKKFIEIKKEAENQKLKEKPYTDFIREIMNHSSNNNSDLSFASG